MTDVTHRQLTREEVCLAIPCSLRKLGYMLKKKAFPPAVRLGRHDYWSSKAVERWRETQFERQETWRPIMAPELVAVRKASKK